MYKDINARRKWLRESYKKKKIAYFRDKYCVWCGSTTELVNHHVDPSKKTSSVIWSWSEERRNKELEKCIVLCNTCHKKHHSQMKPLIHGTSNGYWNKGCRCPECKKFISDYMRDYWVKRKSVLSVA